MTKTCGADKILEKNSKLHSYYIFLINFKNIKAKAAPARAVASCGQLIINNTFLAMPCSVVLAKISPTENIKINLVTAAGIAFTQKFFTGSFEKIKTSKAFPIIIKGIIGAKANGSSPVYIEIKLGIRHNRKADSMPIMLAEIKRRALTMDPVTSWFKKYGAATANATKILSWKAFTAINFKLIGITASFSFILFV